MNEKGPQLPVQPEATLTLAFAGLRLLAGGEDQDLIAQ